MASACIRLGIDMSLFDAAAKAPNDRITISHLAASTGHDALLIKRIMRTLAASGVFTEIEKDTFAPTKLSKSFFSDSPLAEGVVHFTAQNAAIARLPAYFEAKGSPYQNPNDAYDSAFQFALNTDKHSFEWIADHPRLQRAFNVVMTLGRANEAQKWFEYFPVEEKLAVSEPSQIALVDIGGGVGHDLIALKAAHPGLKGKLMLQDLPVVTASARDLPDGIEALGHNMFDAQPSAAHGAKAFFLRNVLHDWPDKNCNEVLRNVRDAIGHGSRLLINEALMPEERVPYYNCVADMNMMAAFSAMDRTEVQFKELIESNGFELVKVWRPQNVKAGAAVVFEAIRKE